MDNIQQYRQPMITATGIFLGFMLNSANGWIPTAFTKAIVKDTIIAISTLISIGCLLLVLFRMLRMQYPTEPNKFYRKTLLLFLIGISIPFFGFLLVILEKLITNVGHV